MDVAFMACQPVVPELSAGGIKKAQINVAGGSRMDSDVGATIA
jgi:hypothetical protein